MHLRRKSIWARASRHAGIQGRRLTAARRSSLSSAGQGSAVRGASMPTPLLAPIPVTRCTHVRAGTRVARTGPVLNLPAISGASRAWVSVKASCASSSDTTSPALRISEIFSCLYVFGA